MKAFIKIGALTWISAFKHELEGIKALNQEENFNRSLRNTVPENKSFSLPGQ